METARRNGTLVANYSYNGRGERIHRYLTKTGPDQTYTLYDEAGHWLGDYDSSGTPIQQAIWLDDLPVGLLVGAGTEQALHYIEADALGTPRAVIDSGRNVAIWNWSLTGEAFGNSPPDQDPDLDGASFVFNLRFPGQRYDAASGLNQNGFRDYEPATGRYTESDLVGLLGGLSTYTYVGGQPTQKIDPAGLGFDDYMSCLLLQVTTHESYDCGKVLVRTAVDGASREFQKDCHLAAEGVICTATCAAKSFIGADPKEIAFNVHKEVVLKALEKVAKESASKWSKKLIPVVGEIDTVYDAGMTIACTITCVKK